MVYSRFLLLHTLKPLFMTVKNIFYNVRSEIGGKMSSSGPVTDGIMDLVRNQQVLMAHYVRLTAAATRARVDKGISD
jgi:hypothetical protein